MKVSITLKSFSALSFDPVPVALNPAPAPPDSAPPPSADREQMRQDFRELLHRRSITPFPVRVSSPPRRPKQMNPGEGATE